MSIPPECLLGRRSLRPEKRKSGALAERPVLITSRKDRLLRLVCALIPAALGCSAEAAVGLLFLVFHLNGGEVEAHLLDRNDVTVSAAADLERGNEQVLECVLQEFLLVLTSLAAG